MADYKMDAAKAALGLITAGQTIGLGAGATVANLIGLISAESELAASLTFSSSSFKTTANLVAHSLKVQSPALINHLDIYFDGCDQFDRHLNALKSGGGIHTTEKILASMARDFVLIGDETKYVAELNTTYPLVIEILPQALQIVSRKLAELFQDAKVVLRMSTQKDGAVISDDGNLLADIFFTEPNESEKLNIQIKMIPGIVEHSLFYKLATKAVIAGEKGVRIVYPE